MESGCVLTPDVVINKGFGLSCDGDTGIVFTVLMVVMGDDKGCCSTVVTRVLPNELVIFDEGVTILELLTDVLLLGVVTVVSCNDLGPGLLGDGGTGCDNMIYTCT